MGEDKSTLLPFHSLITWEAKSVHVGVHYLQLIPIYDIWNKECRAAVCLPYIWGPKSVGVRYMFPIYTISPNS